MHSFHDISLYNQFQNAKENHHKMFKKGEKIMKRWISSSSLQQQYTLTRV